MGSLLSNANNLCLSANPHLLFPNSLSLTVTPRQEWNFSAVLAGLHEVRPRLQLWASRHQQRSEQIRAAARSVRGHGLTLCIQL